MPKPYHDYRVQDYHGRTVIHIEAIYGHDDFLKNHLENDPGMDLIIDTGAYALGNRTGLHLAANAPSDRSQLTKTLIKYGANPAKLDDMGRPPVFYAANYGDFKLLQAYFTTYMQPHDILHAADNDGRSILQALCFPAKEPNTKDHKYKANDDELVKSLDLILQYYEAQAPSQNLAHKALTKKDKFGISPVMYAKHFGFSCFLPIFSKYGIDNNKTQIPERSKGLDKDWYDRNEIMRCVSTEKFYNDKDLVKKLLENPSNSPGVINSQAADSDALIFAFMFYYNYNVLPTLVVPGIQAILEDNRTDITSVDANHKTILHWFVARLSEQGYYEDKEEVHSLIHHLKIMNLLKGMINSKDDQGNTPLHVFVINYREPFNNGGVTAKEKFLDLLIANGANLHARNSLGFTPVEFATYIGKKEAAKLLQDRMKPHPNSACLPFYNLAKEMFSSCIRPTRISAAEIEEPQSLTQPLQKSRYTNKCVL